MRIATWNCYRGGCLERAAELARLAPDVAVIQECVRPVDDAHTGRVVWFGTNPAHGVGVVVGDEFRVTSGPLSSALDHSAFPAIVSGPTPFHLLAIWALPRPSYVRSLLNALDVYGDFLRAAPSVIAGDFNCFAEWYGAPPSKHHQELARRIRDEFGVVSAYHARPGRDATSAEAPTYFWRWSKAHPFHIDYCFVPSSWTKAVTSVHVGEFSEQHWRSDHRPVVVDLDLPPRSVVATSEGKVGMGRSSHTPVA
jgi:exodeoxyribonuclease III